MRMAYTVMQVPPKGTGAFTPTMARTGTSSMRGLTRVVGSPGVLEVSVDNPRLPVMSEDPLTAGSNNAPDIILPDIYIAETDNMGPWAMAGALHTMQSDQVLPVPAIEYAYQATVAIPPSRRGRMGGRKVWPMPRVLQRWQSANSVPQGS